MKFCAIGFILGVIIQVTISQDLTCIRCTDCEHMPSGGWQTHLCGSMQQEIPPIDATQSTNRPNDVTQPLPNPPIVTNPTEMPITSSGLVTITPGPTPPPRPSETPNLENTLSQVVVTTTSAPVNNPVNPTDPAIIVPTPSQPVAQFNLPTFPPNTIPPVPTPGPDVTQPGEIAVFNCFRVTVRNTTHAVVNRGCVRRQTGDTDVNACRHASGGQDPEICHLCNSNMCNKSNQLASSMVPYFVAILVVFKLGNFLV